MNSNQTADQEKALREQGNIGRSSELDASTSTEVEALGKLTSSGRYISFSEYTYVYNRYYNC